MSWDPVAPFWPPTSASSINRTVAFLAPPCCSQVPKRRSKRTQGNGTRWRSKKRVQESSQNSVPEGRHRDDNLELWYQQSVFKASSGYSGGASRHCIVGAGMAHPSWGRPKNKSTTSFGSIQEITTETSRITRRFRFANVRHAGFPHLKNPPTLVEFQRHPTVERCNFALTERRI